MQTLTHSAFLQALGYAITNSLWQMAILWVVVMLCNNLLKLSATAKYRVATIAQVTGFVWFLFTLFFYYRTSSFALAEAQLLQASTGSVIIAPEPEHYSSGLLAFIVRTEQLLPYLSVAYLCLLFFLVVKWVRCYRYTTLIQHNGLHKIDVEWKLFVKKIAAELGIKAEVKIYLSELVTSPLTIGFLKPVILIPIASINHLSVQQLEAIILHEMAHIRRLDYLINLLVSIIELCLFFNPFTQLISRIIKNERENSCDDWVLQYQYQPAMYAEALLRLAYLQNAPALAMAAAGNKQVLLTRVKRMLDQDHKKFNYKQHLLALLLMTGILSSLAWFQPNTKQTDIPLTANNGKAVQAAVIEPLAVKVDNPIFNPISFFSAPLKDEVKKAAKEAERDLKLDLKELQLTKVALREMEVPSLSSVTAEKLSELNIRKINEDLKRSGEDLAFHQKELSVLQGSHFMTSLMNQNYTMALFDSAASFNKLKAFTGTTIDAPVTYFDMTTVANDMKVVKIDMEKVAEEMKKARTEMLKLEKQGLLKWDEKAFNTELRAWTAQLPRIAFANGTDERTIDRWITSSVQELKRKAVDDEQHVTRERTKAVSPAAEKLRTAYQRTGQHKEKEENITKVHVPVRLPNGSIALVLSDSKEMVEKRSEQPGTNVYVTAKDAEKFNGYSYTNVYRPTKQREEMVGPPEPDAPASSPKISGARSLFRSGDQSLAPRVVEGRPIANAGTRATTSPRERTAQGQSKTAGGTQSKTEVQSKDGHVSTIIRIESF